MSALPPEGWSGPDRWDHMAYVKHGATWADQPPKRDWWVCFFVGRHGADYTRWTYKRTVSRELWDAASKDASLGVGHVWTAVRCPAYRTLNGADCTCGQVTR